MHRPYPEVAIIASCDSRLLAFMARLGITPSDRSRVNARFDEIEVNEFAEL
jgi:hypothetical protein